MTNHPHKTARNWSMTFRLSVAGCAVMVLLVNSILFMTSSYGDVDVDADFIRQAKIDTAERLMSIDAVKIRQRLTNNTQMTFQEIESVVSTAIRKRAECEVDAMVDLAQDRPELSLAVLLNWLVGREIGETDHETLGSIPYDEYKQGKRHCDQITLW